MRLAGALAGLCACLGAAPASAEPARTEEEEGSIRVIATTPVPGLGTPVEEIPARVQSTNAAALRERQPRDLTEHLERNFSGTGVNQGQGNPYQADFSYRGFSASPLLGAPQGISVFIDGVRVNETFGDTVNWDLIPVNAIATAHLLAGANPVFGLNTLGGALVARTKSGFSHPGSAARLSAGSFGRRVLEAETGAHGRNADYFVAADSVREDGWREHSSSRVRRLFAKAGWQDGRSDLDLSLAVADSGLEGTQALPLSMLGNRRQPYTWPDRTENALAFAQLKATHFPSPDLLFAGSVYLRDLRHRNLSSNVNDDFDPLAAAGPGNAPGSNTRSQVDQRAYGLSLQASFDHAGERFRNRFTAGLTRDAGRALFVQDEQEAMYGAGREATGIGNFQRDTDAATRTGNRALYFINHFSPGERWHLIASGRYDVTRVSIRDRSGAAAALDGEHRFARFNPALGAAFNPRPDVTLYAGYGEGMRAPTPMELTCADPAAPCRLPMNFLADPPLDAVVGRTVEAGLRARPRQGLAFGAAAYRAALDHDIQFVSSGGGTNAGFFRNVGRTLRAGVELDAAASAGRWSLRAALALVRATFETPFTAHSPANSSADAAGDIQVARGDRIPGLPERTLKLRAGWAATPRLDLGFAWVHAGRQFARGDENNRDANGPLPAYGVAHFDARYEIGGAWQLLVKVDNLFDREYETFAVLGRNFFNGPGGSFDAASATSEAFRTPAAPRALWLSLRYAPRQ